MWWNWDMNKSRVSFEGCTRITVNEYVDHFVVTCTWRSMMAVTKLYGGGYKNLGWLAGGFNRSTGGDFPRVEGSEKLQYATIGGVSYIFLKLLLLLQAGPGKQPWSHAANICEFCYLYVDKFLYVEIDCSLQSSLLYLYCIDSWIRPVSQLIHMYKYLFIWTTLEICTKIRQGKTERISWHFYL